jgi:hypothetical protein
LGIAAVPVFRGEHFANSESARLNQYAASIVPDSGRAVKEDGHLTAGKCFYNIKRNLQTKIE